MNRDMAIFISILVSLFHSAENCNLAISSFESRGLKLKRSVTSSQDSRKPVSFEKSVS